MVRHALATSSDIGASLMASFSHIVPSGQSGAGAHALAARGGSRARLIRSNCSARSLILRRRRCCWRSRTALRRAANAGREPAQAHVQSRADSEALVRGLPTQQRQAHHLPRCARWSRSCQQRTGSARQPRPRSRRRRACRRAQALCERAAGTRSNDRFDRAALQLAAPCRCSRRTTRRLAAELTLLWAARWHADDPEREVGRRCWQRHGRDADSRSVGRGW
jgi:hypothetical protein